MEENGKSGGEPVNAGQVLIAQGQRPGYIYFLSRGAVEILTASSEFAGLDPEIIVSKSKRVGIINGEALFTGFSVPFGAASQKTVRALENSVVTKYPIRDGGIRQIAGTNPSLIINLLNQMFQRLELSISDVAKYTKLYQNLCRLNDNISLMYKVLPKKDISDKFRNKAENLYNIFISGGGSFDSLLGAKFLITDNSSSLKKKYSFPGLPVESLIDPKQCGMIKKFLKINRKILGDVIREDDSILADMIEIVSDNLNKILDRVGAVRDEIDREMLTLFGPYPSWSSYMVDSGALKEWQNSGKIEPDFVKNYLSLIRKLNSYYEEISGKKLVEVYEGPNKVHEYFMKTEGREGGAAASVSEEAGEAPVVRKGNAPAAFRNSLGQIFEFSLADKEFQKTFYKALNEFKSAKHPFDTEQEGRKARRYLTKMYWDLYKLVYIRKQKESDVPAPVKLMLRYGFVDETLMDGEQIETLDRISGIREDSGDIPILYEEEFLGKVYSREENPSITEMGLSYEGFLLEQEKHTTKKKGESAAVSEDVRKVMYEIDHRLAMTVAVCSGSTATAFPILTSLMLKGDPSKNYIKKKQLESMLKELMSVDFSAFYRETTLKLGEARELIYEEVIPNFILIPAIGQKTMLWQDLDGKNRKTRGRIVIPIFFLGDFIKSLAHTFACFRWELNRTIKGGMWADPVDGGVTGAYFDYVNFYKKNPKLSTEAKLKISEKFKSIRTNRDRFADDYIMWVLYEKDGVMRLNNVVRDMFYREIPFKKELRAKLEEMPAFIEIANRHRNITGRLIEGYERRYKKYADSNGLLPEKLQEFMDFLKA